MAQQGSFLVFLVGHNGSAEHRQRQVVAALAPCNTVVHHVGRHRAGAVQFDHGNPALRNKIGNGAAHRPVSDAQHLSQRLLADDHRVFLPHESHEVMQQHRRPGRPCNQPGPCLMRCPLGLHPSFLGTDNLPPNFRTTGTRFPHFGNPLPFIIKEIIQ